MFKEFQKNITRSPYQSLSAIFVVSLAFFLIAVFFFLGAGSQKVLNFFESRPQVVAYLKDETKPQDLELLRAKIESSGKVKKIDYVSKDAALQLYKDLFKDKPLLLEMVTAKFLPASLEISAIDLSSLKDVSEILKKEPIVEDVDFQEDVTTSLSSWLFAIRKLGLGIASFLLIVSILTILVILGMKISQKREEIEILKLLGASPSYIRLPFYLEGIFYGVVAAIISLGLSYVSILLSAPFLTKFLNGIPIFPIPLLFMLEVLGGMILLGILVGFLGSLFAVSRFARTIR